MDLDDALKLVTARQREVLIARLNDSNGGVVPQEVIAGNLGLHQSSVSRRLNGGIRRLRRARVKVDALLARLELNSPPPARCLPSRAALAIQDRG